MFASRALAFTALTGLLAVSCSAVAPSPYGGVALQPPPLLAIPPAAQPSPSVELPVEPLSYDVAPRQPIDAADGDGFIAYDVAPARLPSADIPPASPAPAGPPTKALLGPLPFISQTSNNCGPASIAEVLGFWGQNRTQADVQAVLRGDGNPYGMTPAGVPAYMASLGMDSVLGTAGSDGVIKALLLGGFPVIVNQTVSDVDLEFHYRPVEGFDDQRGVFISSDPLIGPDHAISYAEFDSDWGYTGHRFMVLFPPDKTDAVNAALAAGKWDPAYAEGGAQAQSWSVPGTDGPTPVTTPVVTGKTTPAPNWYTGPVKLAFKAVDQSGFGVANTSYAIDKQPVQLYRGEITVKDSGKHTITFHSVNFSGSREADKTVELNIDQTPPATTATVDGDRDPSGAYKGQAKLTLSAADDGSGVARTTYAVDGAPAQTYSAPVTLPTGQHAVSYSSIDQAGNQEPLKTLTVVVSPAQPAAAKPSASAAGTPAATSAPVPAAPAGGYSVCLLYDPNKPAKPSVPLAIKVQLCDSASKNLSSPAVPLTGLSIMGPPNAAKPPMPSAFRFDAALNGYEADETAGLPQGSYVLYFTIGSDATPHMLQFRIGS